MVLAKKQTPNALIKACNQFIFVENLDKKESISSNLQNQNAQKPQNSQTSNAPQTTWQELDGKTKTLLYSAIKASSDEMGWAYVSQISNYINGINPSFDPRSYGYAKISNMLKNLGNLQFKIDEQSKMYCRKIPLGKLYDTLKELPADFSDDNGWIKIDERLNSVVSKKWDYAQYGLGFNEALQKLYNTEIQNGKIRLNLEK